MAINNTTLAHLRTLARQFANQELGVVGQADAFVTDLELTSLLNFGVREMHDLFTQVHGHEYFLKAFQIEVSKPKNVWDLPDDLVAVKGVDYSTTDFGAFKEPDISGIGEDPSTFFPSYDIPVYEKEDSVPLLPYTFHDRHKGSSSDWSGRWDYDRSEYCPAQFRVLSSQTVGQQALQGPLNLIRITPALTGYLLVWYIPEVPLLAGDSSTIAGFHGFEEYPAVYAALQMAAKQEDDVMPLRIRLDGIRKRISSMASIRDIGHPEMVTDVGGI